MSSFDSDREHLAHGTEDRHVDDKTPELPMKTLIQRHYSRYPVRVPLSNDEWTTLMRTPASDLFVK